MTNLLLKILTYLLSVLGLNSRLLNLENYLLRIKELYDEMYRDSSKKIRNEREITSLSRIIRRLMRNDHENFTTGNRDVDHRIMHTNGMLTQGTVTCALDQIPKNRAEIESNAATA